MKFFLHLTTGKHLRLFRFIIGIALLFIFFSIQTTAQVIEIKNRKFENLIFIGPSFGLLRGSGFDTGSEKYQRTKLGYTVGIGTNYHVSEPFDFSAQIMMESKVTKQYISYNGGQYKAEIKYSFRSFTFVLLPVFRIGTSRKFGVGIGPYGSYIQKQVLDEYYHNPPTYFKSDYTEFLLDWEFGLSFQCYYQIKVNNSFHLSLKLLNQLGLTNINNTEKYPVFGEVRTNATSVLIECTFR
jgi:hypothetical protein